MRSLVPLASMLVAFAAALPAMAQREAQFQAWCFDRATDEQVIEGCSAVIAAGRGVRGEIGPGLQQPRQRLSHGRRQQARHRRLQRGPEAPAFDAVVLLSRCHVRAIVDDLQAALADCNKSLRLAPAVPAALGSRGLVLLKLGRFDEAIADYDAGLKLYAKGANSLYGRGVAKRKKGDVAGGDADIAAAKAIKPDVADWHAKWGVSAP